MIAATQAINDATMHPTGDPILPHAFPKATQDAIENYTYAALFAQTQAAHRPTSRTDFYA